MPGTNQNIFLLLLNPSANQTRAPHIKRQAGTKQIKGQGGAYGWAGRLERQDRDRFVEFFSPGYFKGRDGPAFEDKELANYSTESIYINYSGIMDAFL
jgi:hypothetical protein